MRKIKIAMLILSLTMVQLIIIKIAYISGRRSGINDAITAFNEIAERRLK